MSICLYVCLSICLSIYLSIYLYNNKKLEMAKNYNKITKTLTNIKWKQMKK